MKPLSTREISGTWATLLIPIDSRQGIDFSRLADEIDYLLASGVDGIYSNGTAGEFYAQSEEEFDRIQALLAEKCEQARMPFQVGVSHMSAQVSLARLERSICLAPSAVQLILPDWYPVSDEEAIAFLLGMQATAGPIGLVLYNPPHAKRALQPEDFGKLKRSVPNLLGIKVAGGDDNWYAAMRIHAGNLAVFVPGHDLATGLQKGAAGAYSNVACLQPRGAKKWNELMKLDVDAALDLERRLHQLLYSHILPLRAQGYSNQALDKLLAAIGDWSEVGTRLRWPYQWVKETEAIRLRPIARQLVPEMFEV